MSGTKENKTYCSYFWSHLSIRGQDQVLPCCRFEDGSFALKFNGGDLSDSLLNFHKFNNYRESSLAGRNIAGCRKCYEQESSGILSLRQIANRKFSNQIDLKQAKLISLEVFLGNACNLKCLMCNAGLSSRWVEDCRKLNIEVPKVEYKTDYSEFVRFHARDLRELKLLGGEPFMTDVHTGLLNILMSNGSPEMVELIYVTNGTIEPNTEVLRLWKNFKKVTVFVSIDGVGPINSYIRFPSKWETVEMNLRTLANLSKKTGNMEINVLATVSVLNVWSLIELENWFFNFSDLHGGMNCIGFNPLDFPTFLSLKVIPQEARDGLIDTFDKSSFELQAISKMLETSTFNGELRELRKYLEELDSIRGQSFEQVLPQLKLLFNQ